MLDDDRRGRAPRRGVCVLVGAAVLVISGASPAWGHAKFISATSVPAGTDQPVVMSVPEERGAAVHTNRVVVGVPVGFTVLSCEAKAERECSSEASPDGVVLVTFTRTPGTNPDPLFAFVLHTPAQPGDHRFKVAQTYSSGEVVIWDGPPGSDTPAPVLKVTGSAPTTAAPAPTTTTTAPAPPPSSAP
ncbi:MAG: DUF1775 domain-containing protein, partial [Acidimicrobiia bacterium]